VAAGHLPKEPPQQSIAMSDVVAVEVRDNLWKDRGIDALRQVYLHRKDSPVPMLIYQDRRAHSKHVVEVATRLAERWVVRLRIDDGPL
jgi:hypothetical protein